MGSADSPISDPLNPDIEAAEEPAWARLKDEDLLAWRICDLGVRIEGSELEASIRLLYEELSSRHLALRPICYLGDKWLSPTGVPAIAIPFYLAHPRLKTLELHKMLDVEGGTQEWRQKLLRHECGHAHVPTAGVTSAICRTGMPSRISMKISPKLSRFGCPCPRKLAGTVSRLEGSRDDAWRGYVHQWRTLTDPQSLRVS